MNSTDPLTHAQAESWRTDWKALDGERIDRRLTALYQTREIAWAVPESIPQSWQQFLFAEIAAGEARQQEFAALEAQP